MNRTLGRMLLLSAVAVVTLHGRAGAVAPAPPAADEQSSLGHMLDYQKKLNEKIDYELLVQTTLESALNELLNGRPLGGSHIPWTVNDAAFVAVQLDKDIIKKTDVGPINKLTGVTRATVLKQLLAKIPSEGDGGTPTYIIRRDCIEITTIGARARETERARGDDPLALAVPPPLAYAAFADTPLEDALKELARTTESNIVLDTRGAGKTKVTAELGGVPLDAAVQLLADMADLKLVCVANVYYVTSPKNAKVLQKEEDKRRMGGESREAVPTKPPMAP